MDESADPDLTATSQALEQLVRRLRGFTPRVWQAHRETVLDLVAVLVDIAACAEGTPARRPPRVPDHALGEVVAVIGGDALAALARRADPRLLRRLHAELTKALDATR